MSNIPPSRVGYAAALKFFDVCCFVGCCCSDREVAMKRRAGEREGGDGIREKTDREVEFVHYQFSTGKLLALSCPTAAATDGCE